ncbi:LLM class flavin-dependent oxidoreductase [uncultured Ramlibacter sp.]|uniref:LLM class flavin-dependent oxidoreductase n=1 Tax=uncultured Ramlibacter sp. TaxID=260755 RepID=UPI00262038EA|nr:LLM class flavin-dependent oxidoreductase [uncultured Ramlibacter sp.]
MSLSHLAFLAPGNYDEDNASNGLEEHLQLFAHGEALGFDSAWVRQRHLERSVSSAATFLAAASQRTRAIGLGVAVLQMGYENPFRLAEDLSTVDALSRGRLQVGLSAGAPPFGPLLGERLFDGNPDTVDFSHARVARLRANLSGELLGDESVLLQSPAGEQRPRLRPHAPGLDTRLWYGAGSLRSATWAGSQGFHLLIGNLTAGEDTDDFHTAQQRQLAAYRDRWTQAHRPRVALGRVIVPLDSADTVSRRNYLAFAQSRRERTFAPQGERRTVFAPDLVGSSDEILEALHADPVLREVSELRLELPYSLPHEDYRQILADVRDRIAPALGWKAAGLTRPADQNAAHTA